MVIFLIEKENPLRMYSSNMEWVAKLTYVMYFHISDFNLKETALNFFHLFNKIDGFKKRKFSWLESK